MTDSVTSVANATFLYQQGPIEEDVYLVTKTLLQPVFQTVMTVDRTSELAVCKPITAFFCFVLGFIFSNPRPQEIFSCGNFGDKFCELLWKSKFGTFIVRITVIPSTFSETFFSSVDKSALDNDRRALPAISKRV